MASWFHDIRCALRTLQKSPGYAAVAVLTLAMGIGLNTATFSVSDVLLFRPLLFDTEPLVTVEWQSQAVSPKDYYEWRDTADSFDLVSAYAGMDVNLTGEGDPERVVASRVTWEFFDTIGVAPRVGRAFNEREDHPGQGRVAVLSHELWERRFGADESILGRTLRLNGESFEVIGIAPPEVRFPSAARLWVPLAMSPEEREDRDRPRLHVIARLKPGVGDKQARAELEGWHQRTATLHPDTHENLTLRVLPLRQAVSGIETARYTEMSIWVAVFVLIIACLNVAALQFARITSRMKELTVRLALGAGRWRLLRLVLAENLLVAAAGACIGAVLAQWYVDATKAMVPPAVEQHLPGWSRMAVDTRALLFTAAVSVAAGVLAGILPALMATRVNLNRGLKEGSRTTTAGGARHRLRSVLVAAEVMFTMVLLIGAGLMVKGFQANLLPSPQIKPAEVLTFRLALPETRYPGPEEIRGFHQRLLTSLRALPGVRSAELVNGLPYAYSGWKAVHTLQDRLGEGASSWLAMNYQVTGEQYFDVLNIPLIEGRYLEASDTEDRPLVGLVNESFARRYYPDGSAVGRRIKAGMPDDDAPWIEIVGVVGDVYMDFMDRTVRPTLYRPYRQLPPRSADFAIRTSGDPMELAEAARQAVLAIDPAQPIYNVLTMEGLIDNVLTGITYMARYMAGFGLLALAMALIGLYSVMAHSAAERTGEIGVRMAMGAGSRDVLWMMLRRGLLLTAVGLAGGTALALPLTHLVSSLILGVSPHDPLIFGGVSAAFLVAATTACLVPSLKAARTSPTEVLRYE